MESKRKYRIAIFYKDYFERFFIELIRLNPIVVAGMTQAQIISLIMMITGILLLISRKRLEKQAEAVMV